MFLFKPKKPEEPKAQVESKANVDLEIIMKMNQEFASSLDNDQIRYAVSFGSQKINIHEKIKPITPNALNPSSGSMDICFISKNKINDWVHHLVKKGINIEIGPERKTGALGPILSIYIRDPDFNLIEISNQL